MSDPVAKPDCCFSHAKAQIYVSVLTLATAVIVTMAVNLKFSGTLTPSDPKDHPVLIVGQRKHLANISYDDVSCKLQPRVTAEVS